MLMTKLMTPTPTNALRQARSASFALFSRGADQAIDEEHRADEEEFNIEIPDDVQENIRTVGDAVTHIKAHVS